MRINKKTFEYGNIVNRLVANWQSVIMVNANYAVQARILIIKLKKANLKGVDVICWWILNIGLYLIIVLERLLRCQNQFNNNNNFSMSTGLFCNQNTYSHYQKRIVLRKDISLSMMPHREPKCKSAILQIYCITPGFVVQETNTFANLNN